MINFIRTPLKNVLFAIVFLLFCSSCSLLEIKSQTEKLKGAALIEGEVKRSTSQEGPINVLVFEVKDGIPNFDGSSYASASGHYHFYVTPGVYHLSAHVDTNHDGLYQPGEPVRSLSSPEFLEVKPGSTVRVPIIDITDYHQSVLVEDTDKAASMNYENIGKVISLDSPIFSRENYSMGLWRPMDFLNKVGGGLFFLREYDPNKIPILFVHGVNGGPTDWKSVIEELDTRIFQPWVYYYASGIQLDILSDTLVKAITALQKRYEFNDLFVSAHSMGGLVTRSFVKKFQEQHPQNYQVLKLMVTVNSPLGGMKRAATGIKASPIIVQSWRDVAKGSEFIKKLTAWPWPEDIPYHLIFSFDEGKDGDGAISLSEQLPYEVQKSATRLYGFSDTHLGTLSDPLFITLVNSLFADTANKLHLKQ